MADLTTRISGLETQNQDLITLVKRLRSNLAETGKKLDAYDKSQAPAAAGGAAATKAEAPKKEELGPLKDWIKSKALPTKAEDWTTSAVRQSYVDYFVERAEHSFIPSSRVIPHDDPTLLFANAGMNQYKPIFLGTADPNTKLGQLTAAVNSQKCIRAGGKHNDLEDVGKDVYHHTFFEMLGNWSFNATYFKEGAIKMAWELFTEVWGLEGDRLYVTYFEGDEADGVPADTEARDLWLKYLPAERVLPGNKADNFWEMGETGPCGPCSEIHYDRIGGRCVPELVNMDDPDVLELWNLVFMQFNRTAAGLRPLPSVHVDTGLGLERVSSVLSNKPSNYDTDAFMPFFAAIEKGTKAPHPYTGKVGAEDPDRVDMSYRVLADHIRTLTIAITDGGMPDNVGRGYVLRLILRRAIRYGDEILGAPPGFFPSLAQVVQDTMGGFFPELTDEKIAYVQEILLEEETQFRKTLARGTKLFAQAAGKAKDGVLDGKTAFRLYETFGFPIDLTETMAEEWTPQLTVNMEEYREAEKAHKLRSAGGAGAGGAAIDLDVNAIGELTDQGVPATDDLAKYDYTATDGAYTYTPCKGKILKLRVEGDVCGVWTDSIEEGATVGIVLDKTSFYAEKGGQSFDTGFFLTPSGDEITITNVKSCGPYVFHVGTLQGGTVKLGDELELKMDGEARSKLMANHTVTHVLNYGLRVVLGKADQTGSLVEADKMRFDFTARNALSDEELAAVEVETRKVIAASLPVYIKEVPLADAMEVQGLRAMFGEKYPDPVRMVSVGADIGPLLADPKSGVAENFSVEFCGGTHVRNSADCGAFAILQELAVSKGNRRVECVTGAAAEKAIARASTVEAMVVDGLDDAGIKRCNEALLALPTPQSRRREIEKLINEKKLVLIEAGKAKEKEFAAVANARAAEIIAEKPAIVVEVLACNGSNKALNGAIQKIKKKAKETVIMFLSGNADAVQCCCLVPKKVGKAKGLSAKEWVTEVNAVIGGKLGGSDEVAQCRGDRPGKIDEAIAVAKAFAASKLN